MSTNRLLLLGGDELLFRPLSGLPDEEVAQVFDDEVRGGHEQQHDDGREGHTKGQRDGHWNDEGGLLSDSNSWADWAKPAHAEYFPTDESPGFSVDLEVKLQGRYGRNSPKKSFTLITRKKYGTGTINYKLFDDKNKTSYGGFMLRADATYAIRKTEAGRLVAGDRVKNELVYHINKEMGSLVDMQSYRPVVLYINGNYSIIYA